MQHGSVLVAVLAKARWPSHPLLQDSLTWLAARPETSAALLQVLRPEARHQGDLALARVGPYQPLQAHRVCREPRHRRARGQARRAALLD
jgi:hypothetical protein